MKGSAAIFVKTPGLSPVKTRLAVGIGESRAIAFHLASAKAVAAVVRRAAQDLDFIPYFAVAEAEALRSEIWSSLPTVYQGDGGLGLRLHRVYSELLTRHGHAILLGSDAPQLEADDLREAVGWISEPRDPRFVFGPARDGGFWIFGGNRPLPESHWTSIEYSRPDTGSHLLAKTRPLGAIRTLRVLQDADQAEDLPGLSLALAGLARPLEEQRGLLMLLRDVILQERNQP